MAISKTSIGILIILIISVITALLISTKQVDPNQYDQFAQCLTDKGAKFYGTYWCPHCQSQKELFRDSISKIDYIECSLPDKAGQNKLCNDAGIKSYPTWEFADGSRVNGVLPLEELGQKTGCELLSN